MFKTNAYTKLLNLQLLHILQPHRETTILILFTTAKHKKNSDHSMWLV